jgi:hypothetical protein
MLQDHAVEFLTKGQWLKTVSKYRGFQPPSSHARARRKRSRSQMPGWATLTIEAAGAHEKQTVFSKCRILDVSDEGLAVGSTRSIVPGTAVSIEFCTCRQHCSLSGRVLYCTVLQGLVRVAVKLEFRATDGNDEQAGL